VISSKRNWSLLGYLRRKCIVECIVECIVNGLRIDYGNVLWRDYVPTVETVGYVLSLRIFFII